MGRFGTAPVFLTAISTILGAIMFLRFGQAVGSLGFFGALAIIVVGHLVTIPTALAVAEIATNQRVAGGGEYFIISRSFGVNIGAAIGLALYLSQAISVAFYVIAFAEAFRPVFAWLAADHGIVITDPRVVSLPAMGLLATLMLTKGSDLGVKALYVVVGTLFVALVLFFLGSPMDGANDSLLSSFDGGSSEFFIIFAVCFPAFTGMTAGVGLSGDLKNPKRSIPVGTLSATIIGMLVYVAIAYKLSVSAPRDALINDQLVMSDIALWGPIIPIGLACATISSALGSMLVAPRTLQALAADATLPLPRVNAWLARGRGAQGEPINASLVTVAIGFAFVAAGDVNFVAQIISMFFMVTYGSVCMISFLEHFAADPAYRPAFRSRWYISAFGAAMCLALMIQMSVVYAVFSIIVMTLLYLVIAQLNPSKGGMARLLQGAIFQFSRSLQVFAQKASSGRDELSWRPSVVCISRASFDRVAAFDLLRWVSHRYGFGTYIHYIEGRLSRESHASAREALDRLVRRSRVSHGNVYVDTLVGPSYSDAIAQLLQLPGVSGKENNLVLLEFPNDEPEAADPIAEAFSLAAAVNFDFCVLCSDERGFGYRREIHVWIRPSDYENAGLMILLAYILLGHAEWRGGSIKIYALFPKDELEEQRKKLESLVLSGRLPISLANVELIERVPGTDRKTVIAEVSRDADLVLLGFRGEVLKRHGPSIFQGYDHLGNVLFVNSRSQKMLTENPEESVAQETGPSIGKDLADLPTANPSESAD